MAEFGIVNEFIDGIDLYCSYSNVDLCFAVASLKQYKLHITNLKDLRKITVLYTID